MADYIDTYIKNIQKELRSGKAREHAYRPALKTLIESLKKGIIAVNDPAREECGAPDFIVQKGRGNIPLGYIECKDVGGNLDKAEKHEQMKERYLPSLANLILTNYIEFRYYVQGELKLEATLGAVERNGKIKKDPEGAEDVLQLLDTFLNAKWPSIGTPKELAARMARLAQIIRTSILNVFNREKGKGKLHGQLEAFRDVLISGLTEKQFADMYAQTICYGLFAAICNIPEKECHKFSREHAAYDLPKTNPFLRSMFVQIAGPDLDERISWAVDDLAELLRRADIGLILENFGKSSRREDPVVHFYETFLAQYDSKMRKSRGVFYTPEPVVSYIVKSIDHILKKDFKLKGGLADPTEITQTIRMEGRKKKEKKKVHKVQILDPAVGTGTFLYEVINHIRESFKGNEGMWSGYVSKHLLPRLFGFELLMAPYAVAHMKLGLLLKESGYDFKSDERLNVFLTNTLEEAHLYTKELFAGMIAKEANAASNVKKDVPVMVILGNPPYSGHSANASWKINDKGKKVRTFIGNILQDYYMVDGKPLGERNPKWLQDDYVKFIRFAQHRIEQTGYGVLGFISNHGYLNNPTFRGMRQQLMEAFDKIYILDLHGNSKKKETCPDGSKDENVFDIQQGVAICICIKNGRLDTPVGHLKTPGKSAGPTVRHCHLYGLRKNKYAWLAAGDIASTDWTELEPQTPFYLFTPYNKEHLSEYYAYIKLNELMKINNTGIITSRDKFVFGYSKKEILDRINDFKNNDLAHAKRNYNLRDVRERTLQESQLLIRKMKIPEQYIKYCTHRPFDVKPLFYHHALVRWPVYEVMQHMLAGENVGLVSARSNKSQDMDHFFCSKYIMETKCGERTTQSCIFPLYLYTVKAGEGELGIEVPSPWPRGKKGRRPNLDKKFVDEFAEKLGMEFAPDGRPDTLVGQSETPGKSAGPTVGQSETRGRSAAPTVGQSETRGRSAAPTNTFGPEDIFNYIYAVFHSPTYRSRYAEFLKIDFPRVPLTSDKKLFKKLCALGSELVGLHLLEEVPESNVGYPEKGNDVVEKPRYVEPKKGRGGHRGRVFINKTQYFDNVPPEVWEFHVGGYHVCHKWLKDRKGRKLEYEDITHYKNIVTALGETIRLMAEIDKAIPKWPIE